MLGEFRDRRAEEAYLAAYDQVATHWPARELDVGTRYGPTRVRTSGETGPPVVLLPGGMGTSLSWYPHIADLAAGHRVYAVDTIGEPGRSRQTRSITDDAEYADWLSDVLDGLGHDRILLAGVSTGARHALTLAARGSSRVAAVVAIEPSGFAAIGSRFILWSLREIVRWFDPRPRAAVRRTFRPLLFEALKFRAQLPPPHLFTDEELRAITVPVRLLLAERSAIHSAREVEQRVKRLSPLFDVEVVPRTTHALPLQRPELVTARILTAAVG